VNTPFSQVTCIVSARVIVVAVELPTTRTPPFGAGIVDSASIAIIAIYDIGHEGAATLNIARVVGAEVAIIADELPGTDAFAQVAMVTL